MCRCPTCVDTRQALRVDEYKMLNLGTWHHDRAECMVEFLAALPRPWLVFAGDSNWRFVFERLLENIEPINGVSTLKAVKPGARPTRDERWLDARWFDDDVIVTTRLGRRLRMSFRFMWNYSASLRHWLDLGSSWHSEIRQCRGSRSQHTWVCNVTQQPVEFSKWPARAPHMLVFTQGLWGLPNVSERCSHEFTATALREVSEGVAHFWWATNFPINHHHSIKNEDVAFDYECQRIAAQRLDLPMLDVSRYVGDRRVNVTDVHFVPTVADALLKNIMNVVCPTCGLNGTE